MYPSNPSRKKTLLKEGNKIATDEMIKNGDYLFLKPNSNTVVRTWGGNEGMIGDKYNRKIDQSEWRIV